MKKSIQPFHNEYMAKRRPNPPRCICINRLHRMLGIISPSLRMAVALGMKGKQAAEELEKYDTLIKKHMCYKRALNKEQWKELYREHRKKQ